MQVNSSNGSLQQRIFSGTGSIGGVHLPDFNDKYVFSKKKSGISDEEYRKQIVAQAYILQVQVYCQYGRRSLLPHPVYI